MLRFQLMNNFGIKSYGIVQGRLTIPPAGELQWFPQASWQKEFSVAKDLNIDNPKRFQNLTMHLNI